MFVVLGISKQHGLVVLIRDKESFENEIVTNVEEKYDLTSRLEDCLCVYKSHV